MTPLSPRARAFGKHYYVDNYRDYVRQNPPHKLAFYKKLVERAARAGRPNRILDMGCAFGSFLSHLDQSWQCFGTDISEFALVEAHARLPHARFFAADAVALPCKEVFDIIVAFDILEHIPDLESAASNINSRLAPGGCFIFVVPAYDGPTGPLITLLDRDTTHVHKMPRTFWLEWAATYFDVFDWQGIYRCLIPWGWYIHVPTKMFRSCTPAIAVVAKSKA